jgi:RHS repeat-associated protein
MKNIIILLFLITILDVNVLQAQYPDVITMERAMVGEATIVARHSIKHLPGFKAKTGIKYRAYIDPNFIPAIPYEDPLPPIEIDPEPSQDRNYIISKTATNPASVIGQTTADVMIDISYFDGLGRPVQNISSMASPDQMDIINYSLYDGAGRLDKLYMSYKSSSPNQNSQFEDFSNFKLHQESFIEDEYNSADKAYGFTQYVYESNPLNRVIKNSVPGAVWRITSENPHYLSYEYSLNSTTINSWRRDNNGAYQSISYGPGELMIEVSKNENQNLNQSITKKYKDKFDHVVMVEVMIGSTSDRTLYIYDIFDKLCCVMTPMANTPNMSQDVKYCYFYKYDDPRHRMTEKQVPGSGIQYFIYDKRDRLVMTQDGNLRNSGTGRKWYLTSYDDKNRKVMFGIYEHNNTLSQHDMQDKYNDINNFNEYLNGNYNDIYHGYTKNVPDGLLNCCSNDVLLVYYYDIYNFQQDLNFDQTNTVVDVNEMIVAPHTQGLLTGTKVRVLNPEPQMMRDWMLSAIYYNKRERPIQEISNSQLLNGREVTSTEYNFLGSITRQNILFYSDISNPASYSFTEGYSYDHRNRSVSHTIEGLGPKVLLSFNTFSPIGSLSSVSTHAKANGSTYFPFMQKTDFQYNIRGWLTHINDPDNAITPEKDLFSMRLYYESAFSNGDLQYNGNISASHWTTARNTDHFGYHFSYDQKNQLTNATFYKSINGSWTNDNSYNENNISYDKNGNIKTLDRFGGNAQKIDQLAYSYLPGENRISYIQDMIGDVPEVNDYPGNMQTNPSYYYDANGNTVKDFDKSISTNIDYNYLNLPREIDFGNNQVVVNFYDANGIKRGKKHLNGNEISNSSLIYCGRFIFTWDLDLLYILTKEGRVVPESSNYRYEYFLKDHLGNTRVLFADAAIGIPQIVEYQHYYPFGMQMEGISYNTGMDIENNFLFNGKELQRDYDLQWYDYGARFYDPQIGRWHSEDPKAEENRGWSPYRFAFNNPMRFFDPDGMLEDDHYINDDGTIQTVKTDDSFDRFFLQDRMSETGYKQVAQLEKNEAGLVNFPESGTGFTRYGEVDAGGESRDPVENVGTGDHYILPETAAALFGLTNYVNTKFGITLSLGDMSSSNGSDPWQNGYIHHGGHGHWGNRSGLDVDIYYSDKNGNGIKSINAFSSEQYNTENNQRIFDAAKSFGFTRNFQGLSGDLKNVQKSDNHDNHGHLGLIYNKLNWTYVKDAPIR